MIRVDTGLSNTVLGLLTTLPLIAFGILSTLTPLFTRKIGIEKSLAGALLLLTVGIVLRSFGLVSTLFLGTIFLGIAIAFGNVLLPALVKRDFNKYSGVMTSLYSSMMGLGASLGAGLSVPLAENLSGNWKSSLGIWAILAFIAFCVWLPQVKYSTPTTSNRSFLRSLKDLGGNSLAWKVALFLGLQSFVFYVVLAWLPDILISKGFDSSEAGWYLSLSQITGLIGSILVPTLASRRNDQRGFVWLLLILETVCLAGIWFAPNAGLAIWISIFGASLGGSFSLALLFIVLRTGDSQTAAELSGMSQSVGYLLAALGPILIGASFDVTGNWTIAFFLLLVSIVVKVFVGLGAGKDRQLPLA